MKQNKMEQGNAKCQKEIKIPIEISARNVHMCKADFEKLFIDYEYPNDFNLEKLIKEIDEKIKNHPKLKDITLIEKKKKLESMKKIRKC